MNETASVRQPIAQIIKSLAEALTVATIMCYTIGFIIVNSYLLTFGYSGNALFKTTYISAGIFFLLLATPFALSLYSIFVSRRLANNPDPIHYDRHRLPMLGVGMLGFVSWWLLNQAASNDLRVTIDDYSWPWQLIFPSCLGLLLILLTLETFEMGGWIVAKWAKRYRGLALSLMFLTMLAATFKSQVLYCLFFVAIAVYQGMQFFIQEQPITRRFQDWPPSVVAHMVTMLVTFLAAISIFGTELYGHIKPQFGGGQPARVRVVIPPDKLTALTHQGVLKNLSTLLADTQLIDSSDKELSLLLKSTHGDKGLLLQVDRSIVDAVLYLAPSP
jgi:hypothetical protein